MIPPHLLLEKWLGIGDATLLTTLSAWYKSVIQQALKLLELLSDNNVHSGVELGSQLGVSRAAVWKLVQRMQQTYGVDIKSINSIGYCLASPLALLKVDQIRNHLVGLGAEQAYSKIIVLDSINSTNDVALVEAAKGAPDRSVWLAEHQAAGRGRRGKTWQSPFLGNIYCSLLWRLSGGAAVLEGLSLAVGIALAEGLTQFGLSSIQLKWPNDLWVDDKKLGGVLIEISGDPYDDCAAVIGFGINVRLSEQMCSNIDQPVTSLAEHVFACDRNQIVALLLSKLDAVLLEHRRFGFSAFMDRWQRYDALYGRHISTAAGESSRSGICLGISSRGALLIETAEGVVEVHSGEVSVRPK